VQQHGTSVRRSVCGTQCASTTQQAHVNDYHVRTLVLFILNHYFNNFYFNLILILNQ